MIYSCFEDDFLENDEESFEKLVLRYIYKDEINTECDIDYDDEILSPEEFEDYLTLAEHYYSR